MIRAVVIHGEQESSPIDAARDWSTLYARGELLLVPAAAHMPHVSAPAEVFEAIRRFTKGSAPLSRSEP